MQKVLREILKEITPTTAEIKAEHAIVNELQKKIRNTAGKHVGVTLVGSLARNTHLRGDRDIDLFVFFPKHLSRKQFEQYGLSIGKKILKGHFWEQAYSEHPYIRGTYKGFDVEIVPTYKVNHAHQKMSSVDRSPFHNQFLQKKQTKSHKQNARLLKQFLKGIKAYGADLHYNALPGFGVELLIQHYKTFPAALRAISKWKKTVLIDIAKKTEQKKALLQFADYPLILIDPTDENRNVAAALSNEQFLRMQKAAAAFLKKPSATFFFPAPQKALSEKQLRQKLKKKFIAGFWMPYPKNALSDIVWGQVRKLQKQLQNRFVECDFTVKKTGANTDEQNEIIVLCELSANRLAPTKLRVGPFKTDVENAKRFLSAHRGAKPIYTKDGHIALRVKREIFSGGQVLEKLEIELNAHLKEPLANTFPKCVALTNSNVLKLARNHDFFGTFLTEFLKKNN